MHTIKTLNRTIEFIADNFFERVRIKDATRSKRSIPTKIELPRSHRDDDFKEGESFRFKVKDDTPGRLTENRFYIASEGKLFYRTDSEETITITLGSDADGTIRQQLRKMQDVRNSHCGTYLISIIRKVPYS